MRTVVPHGFHHLHKAAKWFARAVALIVLVFASMGTVTSASVPDGFAAFERINGVKAPPGYVPYAIRIWGARAAGSFTEISVDAYGQLVMRSEAGNDGHVDAATLDQAVRSIVFLPDAFKPAADLRALRVSRPVDFQLGPVPPAPFTLRFLGNDPTDPAYRLYETYFPGKVVTGTLSSFELNGAAVKQGYPYRGPVIFRGWTKRRPPQFPGEKSVVRI